MNFTNILGTITAILTTVAAFLTALGCAPGASDFVATCQIDFLPAEWVAYIAIAAGGVFGALALIGKLTRPGPQAGEPVRLDRRGGPGGRAPSPSPAP
jgi:TRAP-type C4-dicarboxylate transport system permease small subunit